MELYWILISVFVICLPMQCLTLPRAAGSSADAKDDFGADSVGFTSSSNPGNLQAWSDWLNKRSFGDFPFGDKHLQAWREWMEKRSLLQPGSGPRFGSSNNFQQWQDWMNKRGGMMGPAYSAPTLQSWNDWMKKRAPLGLGAGSPSFGQPSGGKFQSWRDFSKRENTDKDFMLNELYKRSFGMVKPTNPFNVRFGSNPNLMKWDDMMKRSADKRQLGNSPAGFGRNKQYFTNGLQDWRYTFQNAKRAANNAKNTKHESN